MKLANITAAAILMVATLTPAHALELVPRVDHDSAGHVTIERLVDFERNISIRIRTDPSRVPPERQLEILRSLDLRDGQGVKIDSRSMDFNAVHDVVLGFSGGTAEIIKISQTPRGLQVIGSFKSYQGQVVSPPRSSVAVANLGGDPLCFEYEEVDVAKPPMHFVLLLDRSGSMSGHMSAVKSATRQFIDLLPSHAICTVVAFDHQWSFSQAGLGTRQCVASNFNFASIDARGSTDIFGPVTEAYRMLGRPALMDHQKAVVVLTDGVPDDDLTTAQQRRKQLQSLKGDVVTFAYWLGNHNEQYLRGLADSYIENQGDVGANLGRYFDILGDAYTKQTVLTIRSCKASAAKSTN